MLMLDMKKVAKMDDTILIAHEDFLSEDCKSADSFKARILNTNLIINKQMPLFREKEDRPNRLILFTDESSMTDWAGVKPSDNGESDMYDDMASLPRDSDVRLDSLVSLNSNN